MKEGTAIVTRINIRFEYYDVNQSNSIWFMPLKIRAKIIRLKSGFQTIPFFFNDPVHIVTKSCFNGIRYPRDIPKKVHVFNRF